jgi:hypothetical protein
MTIRVLSEQEVLQEGLQVLMTHLEPSKVLRFWSACKLGKGDYLKLQEQLFDRETVASLYDKVKAFQEKEE